MTSMFNMGKSEYLKALQDLENITGQDITGKAASLQFQRKLPQLGKVLSGNLLGGGWELAKAILAAPLSSPRSAAAISRYLQGGAGLGGRVAGYAAQALAPRVGAALPGLLPTYPAQSQIPIQ
jgi:hypothetical protein